MIFGTTWKNEEWTLVELLERLSYGPSNFFLGLADYDLDQPPSCAAASSARQVQPIVPSNHQWSSPILPDNGFLFASGR